MQFSCLDSSHQPLAGGISSGQTLNRTTWHLPALQAQKVENASKPAPKPGSAPFTMQRLIKHVFGTGPRASSTGFC